MDDLISRQAMLDGIDKLIKIHFDRTVVLYKARKVAEDLPSIQPDTTTHDSISAETGKNDGDRTSGDCISRTQAIDALRDFLVEKRCPDDGTLTCRLIENEVINKLPSIQPEQPWIPVTERLPEEGKVVLTQAKFKDDVKMAVSSRIDYNYWTTWGTRDINIVAWMPLPEPYQEGEQDGRPD